MDEDFGSIRAPEKVDEWEKGRKPESISKLDEMLGAKLAELEKLAQYQLFKFSARAKNYIWAMNETGEIIIAVEELALEKPEASYSGYPRRRGYRHPSEEKKLGHPTLLNGGKARIAGELAFDEDDDNGLVWILNANSGRYCKQKPPTPGQLNKVAEIFKSRGVDVKVDYE
ncbi:hypothetical protein FY150_08865 [Agrobacterium tumefaciens]|nr:hypothetical protein FY150_08865 [Agrobacterium tumefaciens]